MAFSSPAKIISRIRTISTTFTCFFQPRYYSSNTAAAALEPNNTNNSDTIYTPSSVFGESMPLSSTTGSIIGKKFYNNVTTKESEDGIGWNVMLDYRTLKTPARRPLKLPTLALAKAVAAEWEYQLKDGIRPFTMPLMRLSCTALERVPLIRERIIENCLKRFHTDLIFCRAPDDGALTSDLHDLHVQFINPLLDWMESLLGVRPVIYTSIFGGRQPQELVDAVKCVLKKTNDWELAAIDSLATSANSLSIAIAIFHGRLDIEEAMKLIRLEEDLQVDGWGLVEGGHDIDISDLRVQISSAVVLLGLVQN